MTPLAAEILTDLEVEFPAGASLRMLMDWLGEPADKLKGAIAELKLLGLAHSSATRIHAGLRPSRGDVRRDAPKPKPSIAEIAHHVAREHAMALSDLTGPSRLRPIAHARQEAMYEARRLTSKSTTQIGQFFGRDHSTVVHACQVHEARMLPEMPD